MTRNKKRKNGPSTVMQFEYDEFGQLIKVRNGTNSSANILEEYTYDPYGERVKIKRFDSANTTIYTPFKELMQIRNSSGTFDYVYVYQDGVLVSRLNQDGTKYFYHPDHLGSTTLITDSAGNVVENTSYEPFGALLLGGQEESKLYTGQFNDELTGQYYYGVRYYDPGTDRFIQPDQHISVYNPQSLNRYSYALNNPYKFKDDSGNLPVPVITGIIGGVIGGGIDLGVQLYQNHGDFSKVNWGEVGVSTAAGAVAGATFGLGTTVAGTGFAATVGSGAAAGVAGGQSQIAGENILEGDDLTEGLFEVEDVIEQATSGGISGGVGYGIGRVTSSFSSNSFSRSSSPALTFTKSNFRENLARQTGINPKGYDAHHTLPAKFGKDFSKAGINIHNPSYGQWAESSSHRQTVYSYNQKWKAFFKSSPKPTKTKIESYRKGVSKTSTIKR